MRIPLLCFAGLLTLLATSLRADDAVKVLKPPATAQTRTFDPANRPQDMPPLNIGEAALTKGFWTCSADVGYSVALQENPRRKATATITSVTVKLSLHNTLWLPEKASERLKSHEDGHRRLAEMFYKDSDAVAAAPAQALIGRTFSATGKDSQAAVKDAVQAAIDGIAKAYLANVEAPCQRIQAIYDDLTRHGTNDLPEDTAIEQAMKQYQSEQK